MVFMLLSLLGVALSKSAIGGNVEDQEFYPDTLAAGIPSVQMLNQFDTYYIVKVAIGTPPVMFNLAVDTGSNVTWVLSSACSNCFTTNSTYNPAKSSTSSLVYPNSGVIYEDSSSVSGPGYSDVVSLAGLSTSITFIAATTTSLHFVGFSADGILGLGFLPIGTKGSASIINALVASNQIQSAEFSLYYSDSLFIGRLNATLTLGAANITGFANATLSKYNVTVANENTGSGLWQFTASNVELGNVSVSNQAMVVVDSSQEWIFAPQNDYFLVMEELTYYGFVKKGWYFQKACNNSYSGLPTLFIGYNYTDYLQIPPYRYIFMSGTKNNYTCYVYIFQSDDNSWYVGDSLFRTYYSVFNVASSSITFMPAAWLPNIQYKYKSHSSSSDDSMAGWLIAVIVIVCVVGVLAIGGIAWYVIKRRGGRMATDSMGKPLQEVSLHA